MAITLKEALKILESGEYVSLRFITADFKKGAAGKVMELAKCKIVRSGQASGGIRKFQSDLDSDRKNPNHNYHFTRNVQLPNKQIRKVHPILITHINNMPVL